MTALNLDREELINRTAAAIKKRGWQVPASAGLEVIRPLSFVGGQLLWVLQPFMGLFFSSDLISQTAEILEEPEAIDLLIQRLETTEDNREKERSGTASSNE